MKKQLLLVLLIFPFFLLIGQTSKDKKEVEDSFWDNNQGDEYSLSLPDKWKDESAVILFKNINYDYNKSGYNKSFTHSTRKRIYLNDQAALGRYSEFALADQFTKNEWYYILINMHELFFGFKIYKSDGTVIKIDTEKELKGENIYANKIAISNLEVGDVIDYYISVRITLEPLYFVGFFPVEKLLADEYPIRDLKIDFNIDNDYYLNFKTYNGAPDLEGLVTDTRKNRRYQIIEKDLEKIKTTYWSYPYNYLPCYRMKVNYVKSNAVKGYIKDFISEDEKIIKHSVNEQDVLSFLRKKIKPSINYNNIKKDVKRRMDSKNYNSVEEKIEDIYYYLRYGLRTQSLDKATYYMEDILDDVKYTDPYFSVNTISGMYEFCNMMIAFLNREGIKYDVIMGTARYNGTLENMLLSSNAEVLIRVPLEDGREMYLDYFEINGNVNLLNPNIEKSKAYALNFKYNILSDVRIIDLPVSTYQDNKVLSVMNIAVENMQTVEVVENVKLFGHQKDETYKSIMCYMDVVNEDNKMYSGINFINRISARKNEYSRIKERVESFEEEFNKAQEKKIQTYFETEYDAQFEKGYKFNMLQTGRFSKDTEFEYDLEFNLQNQWIKKAGQNYLFEIGKCIGGQKSIKEDEKERDYDIDMSYARSYDNEINFTIPEGYIVKGIDKLNKKVVNETGGFESIAVLEGNVLKITAKKYYADNHVAKENWFKMVAFLDAAYQFTQEKILLKKI